MGRGMRWLCCIFSKSTKSKNIVTRSPKYIRQDNASVDEMMGRRKSCGDESVARFSYDAYSEAVAAASATAVEAAVVAAQAAVEVVRLTRSGRFEFDLSQRAAVFIQSTFRGFLARKALRALRSLVKLQALVRGYIVRKQAAEHMKRMHALLRAQAHARAIRALAPSSSYSSPHTTHSSMLDTATSDLPEFTSGPDSGKGRYDYEIPHCDEERIPYSPNNRNLQFHKENYQPVLNTVDNSSSSWFENGSSRSSGTGRRYPENHCGRTYQEFPNYMSYTKSSEAKLRSLSAPKRRAPIDSSTLLKSLSSRDSFKRASSFRSK